MGRVHGVSGEVRWGVGGGEGSCGRGMGIVGGGVGKCVEVWGRQGKMCERVYRYEVSGKCVGLWGEKWGRSREVC